jgi:large subunit ribosomal protein L23
MANTQEAPKVRGPKLEPHQIILRPLITEKGQHQSTGRHRAYPFEVNPWSSKEEIKAAAEELFGVQVDKVRTQNRQGKKRRYRFKAGRQSNWKKAIVTLKPDSPGIDFF